MKHDKARLHSDFKCRVRRIQYDFVTHTGTVYMEELNATDMTGTIEFFTRIAKDVNRIAAIAGDKPDIVYALQPSGKWGAIDQRSLRANRRA